MSINRPRNCIGRRLHWNDAKVDLIPDGAVGAMVIHGPTQEDFDIDVGPVLLSDWFHTDYYSIVQTVMSPSPLPPRPTSDNNLIQGKMSFNCSTATDKTAKCSEDAGMARFHFQSGKRHRLRLINTGADATQQFSIDGHAMTVIANDFVPVEVNTGLPCMMQD